MKESTKLDKASVQTLKAIKKILDDHPEIGTWADVAYAKGLLDGWKASQVTHST